VLVYFRARSKGTRGSAWWFISLVALLIALCIGAAGFSLYSTGLKADAAAWVQAAGSIAAIAGAAWIAGAEARRQRRVRRQEREELAWSVRFALVQAKSECNAIAWEIVGTDAAPKAADLRHWRLRTGISKNTLQGYAVRTDHAHPSVAHVASNGVFLLEQLEEDLAIVSSHLANGELVPQQLSNDVTWYVGHFEQLIQMYDERMRGVMLALDKGGDVLPVRDWEDWKVPSGEEPQREQGPQGA
jgi:hypothetical protein